MSGAIESWALVQHIKQKERRAHIEAQTWNDAKYWSGPDDSSFPSPELLGCAVWKVIEEGQEEEDISSDEDWWMHPGQSIFHLPIKVFNSERVFDLPNQLPQSKLLHAQHCHNY